jgi:transmembrane sensor
MVDDIDGPRLTRYIAGECSAQEAEEIRRWIAADPSRGELVDSLQRVWEATGRAAARWDVDAVWRAFVAARSARQVRPLRAGATAERRQARWRSVAMSWPVRIAAAFVLTVSGGLLWRAVNQPRTRATAPHPMRLYATARGERADLHLADGTRIALNVDSRLRLPLDFGQRTRTVYLEGEAYFQVQHDSTRPFRVVAANAVTEDLGTGFVVRAYAGATGVRVVVTKGRVALRQSRDTVAGTVLSVGDLGRLDTAGVVTVRSGVDVGRYTAWTEGRLEFVNTPLAEVVSQLERWYDLDITLADSGLRARPLTATLGRQSTDEMLRLLAASLDVRVQRDGRRVTLHALGTKP